MKTEILAQMGIINELNSMVVKALGIEKQYLRHDLFFIIRQAKTVVVKVYGHLTLKQTVA